MSNSGLGYWEVRGVEGTHIRDKGENENYLSLHTCFEIPPGFSSQRCSVTFPKYIPSLCTSPQT